MKSRLRSLAASLAPLLGIPAVTVIGRAVHLNAPTAGFVFLIVVLLTSLRGGLAVSALASVLATLCFNFFFLPPFYTFTIQDPANWIALAVFLVTSVTVSRLVIAARVHAERAEQRSRELETLHALSIELFSAGKSEGALAAGAQRALTLLGAREGGLVLSGESIDKPEFIYWSGERTKEIDDAIAAAIHRQQPLEIRTSVGRDVYVPFQTGGKSLGALVARGSEASQHALVAASRLVSLAVEHERLIDEHARMEALRQSEELKTSLLRAISHDLSTPLTAITIHTEALKRRAASERELREPVTGIASETARLRRRIDNLLSMARLEAGKASPRREPAPPADLFRAARENLSLLFEPGELRIHVDDACPDANVDPSLALEVLVNLIENARRVSPPGVPVELEAHAHPSDAATVRIEVLDRGPGLPAGVADADGNLLAGAPGDIAQRGMGLEIARSFVAANGGTIAILPRDGGGTIARVDLPAAALSGIAEPA